MQNRIYLDVFFVINFIMDYLVLSVTFSLLEEHSRIWRRLLAAFFGGIWAVLVLVLMKNHGQWKILWNLATYTLITVLMLVTAADRLDGKKFLKAYFTMFVTAFCLSGICYALWYHTSVGYLFAVGQLRAIHLVLGGVCLFVIKSAVKMFLRVRRNFGNDLCKVELTIENNHIQLQGLIDTGNVLKDPYTGQNVHIVRSDVLKKLLWEKKDYTGLHYRLVPFRSVGKESGLIPVIDVDCMKVFDCRRMIFKDSAAIGIYDGILSGTSSYDALINAAVFRK